MSIYRCAICDEYQDEDFNVCEEWGDGLICEDCYTEVSAAYEDDTGRNPDLDGPFMVWKWAKAQ